MSSAKPVKIVNATCACGASFTREVKRGRPQVWCPKCVNTPFYERISSGAAREIARIRKDGTPANTYIANDLAGLESVPERIVNENDNLDAVRPDIEAAVATINIDHKVRYAALVAEGMSTFDAADKALADTLAATVAVYTEFGGATWWRAA